MFYCLKNEDRLVVEDYEIYKNEKCNKLRVGIEAIYNLSFKPSNLSFNRISEGNF
jgi:hypothetical protein